MKITEQSIIPKSKTAEAEDGIVITEHFIAVIDGSTSKSSTRISPEHTNGCYCMLLICEYIQQQARYDITAGNFCDDLTEYIREHYDTASLTHLAAHPEERLTASCIVYSRFWHEIWMIGDCQCLIDGQLYDNPKPYESELADKRAAIIRSLIDEGKATVESLRRDDIARKAIIPEMICTMAEQNKTYSVVDGFPIPMEHVRIITLTPSPHTIILASDGYPFLLPTLAETETALHYQLTTDPLNALSFKATKAYIRGNNSFDDRTYIRFDTE